MQLKTMKQLLSAFLLTLLCIACTDTYQQRCGYAYQREDKGNWGIVSTEGNLLTTDVFAYQPTAMVNGMFAVPDMSGRYKLYNIDSPLLPVNDISYYSIGHFFEDVTWAQETPYSPILLIDKQGNIVSSTAKNPQYDIRLTYNFSDGLALIATNDGKYGYIDTQGNIAIPPIYDRANSYHNNIALVGMSNANGSIGFQLIDKSGKPLSSIRLDKCALSNKMQNGLIFYRNIETGRCGFINSEGLPLISLPEDVYYAEYTDNEKIIVQTDNGYGIIHPNGKMLLKDQFDKITDMGNGRLAYFKESGWYMTDYKGNTIATENYQYLGHFHSNSYAIAKQNDNYIFIDKEGKKATPEIFYNVVDDKTAFYGIQQHFICRDSVPTNEKKKQTTVQQTEKYNRIETNAWKKIAEESPFFNEAKKVLNGNLEEKDAQNRQMILNYVEHLRTSYTTKDIDFLEQLFSENALIIVGTVIKMAPKVENNYLPPEQIIYNVKSKREYLDKLKLIFKTNQTIDLNFSEFQIMRHPTQAGIYGVVLKQGYQSDHYSDEGYLFLLWDFRDKTAPKIHVRTWQPSIKSDHTPLTKEEVFNIRNFNLQ